MAFILTRVPYAAKAAHYVGALSANGAKEKQIKEIGTRNSVQCTVYTFYRDKMGFAFNNLLPLL